MTRSTPSPIRVALPNKGRLAERSLTLFEQAGLRPSVRPDRALFANLGGEFQAIFVRAADVPEYIADGAAEVGITGADLVAESGKETTELLDLGFGRCRLVVAVGDDETSVNEVTELPAGTRVATSFPNIARRYFDSLGIPVEVARVHGATEVAPHLGVADVIVDLTSTGSTLAVHGLREIGTVMESSARLVASRRALESPEVGAALETLAGALGSVVAAQAKRYLMANVPRDRLEEVREVLPGLSGPTIVEVLDSGDWVAAHAVVDADDIYRTVASLKEMGATGLLVTRIERLMP